VVNNKAHFWARRNKMTKETKKRLFSEKVSTKSRTYFFDVKEASNGNKYLTITESRLVDGGTFKRNYIMIFENNLITFNDGLNKAIEFLRG
jgi:hypothetical protein